MLSVSPFVYLFVALIATFLSGGWMLYNDIQQFTGRQEFRVQPMRRLILLAVSYACLLLSIAHLLYTM